MIPSRASLTRSNITGDDELPRLKKARRIIGHELVFRDVEPNDADFIVALRHSAKNKVLARPTIESQIAWLDYYRRSHDQAYFVICDRNLRALGTVRLYDAVGDSFCWGSWLIADWAPARAALESALMVYRYGTQSLGFTRAHFNVHKDNRSVQRFHERFGAKIVREDEQEIFYEISGSAIQASHKRYSRFLPSPVEIIG